MAITRIHQIGFETGYLDELDYHGGMAIYSSYKYTGAYSVRGNSRYGAYVGVEIPATKQIRGNYKIRMDTFNNWDVGNLFTLKDSSFTTLVALGFSAVAEKQNNNVNMYVAGSWQGATTSKPLSVTKWLNIGFDIKMDASAGWVKIWIEGILEFDFSGNTNAIDIEWGEFGTSVNTGSGTSYWYIDDLYVDDTTGESSPSASPPVMQFYYLKPNAAGNYAQWTPSTGDNYACVDEVPPSDADYVSVGSVGQKDSYNLETLSLESWEVIVSLIPIARIKRGESTETVKFGTRLSSTDLVGSEKTPGADYKYLWDRHTTKPGGGSWDNADLDDVELLQESSGSY